MSVWGLVTEKMACMRSIALVTLNVKHRVWARNMSPVTDVHLQSTCLQYAYRRSNILVPVWENITSDPCPGWGNSLLASSRQESTGRSPELLHQALDILSRYQTRWASDELSHGWGPRESPPTPFVLHVHPAEPVTRRTVQSSGAD